MASLKEFFASMPVTQPLDKLREERDKKITRTRRIRRLTKAGIAVAVAGVIIGGSCGVCSMMTKGGSDDSYENAPEVPSP